MCLFSGNGPAYQVRVGTDFSELGERGDFANNPLCFYSRMLTDSELRTCDYTMTGDVITVQAVDPTSYDHLQLCRVRFNVDNTQM